MNLGGWIFLIFGWGTILSLTAYCFFKVMKVTKNQQSNKKGNK